MRAYTNIHGVHEPYMLSIAQGMGPTASKLERLKAVVVTKLATLGSGQGDALSPDPQTKPFHMICL